jgi:hypothetical protein
MRASLRGSEARAAVVPGKASKARRQGTVLQTDTGGRAENAKAHGRIHVKELGKIHT